MADINRRIISICVNGKWTTIRDVEWESAQSIAWEMSGVGIKVKWWHPTDRQWYSFVQR